MSSMLVFRSESPAGRPPLFGLGHHIVKILGLVVSFLVSVAAAQAQSWVATGSMSVGRVNHAATVLTDRRVLVTGGLTPAGIVTPTAEIYDPATATWTVTGSMSVGRSSHTTTLLHDGRVLVAGGQTPTETATSAELYDPATGTWTVTGGMGYPRLAHTATVLTDGRVLVAGGEPPIYMTPSAELFDPVTDTWTATGSMNYARGRHTATLLADGRVLVAGGGAQWVPTTPTAELYDPAAGTWTATGSMSVERFAHTATLLTDGTVLVAGGGSNAASCADPFCFAPVPFATAEVFDLATGTWRPTGAMNDGRVAHTATMLANGKVLVAGGALGCAPTPIGGTAGLSQLRSAEAYDSVTGTWVPLTLMQTGRSSHTAVLRNDGRVLVAGGISATITTAFIAEDGSISGECQVEFTGEAETYDPGPPTATQPPIASFTSSCSGLRCTFDGSSSADPDGAIIGYLWNFGDGTAKSGRTGSHTYAAAGTYTVLLTVTDNAGATGTQSKSVSVVNALPLASFTSVCNALTCGFDGSTSSDSDGTITSYSWTLGDGTTGSGPTVGHTYAAAGLYTVTLTVTDNAGTTGTQSKSVTVGRLHVGDLDGTSTSQQNTWTATVTITVHDSGHQLVANATVSGSWSGGGGTGSCTTNGSGQCTVSKSLIPKRNASVTFAVVNITHATLTYASTDNHDPDGDSNGSSITVSRR